MKWNALSLRLPLLATALAISVSGVAAACDKNESAATSSEKKTTVAASSCCMKAAGAAAACQKKTEPAAATQAAANTAQPTAAEPSATAPMDAGMRAYIDPETGLVTSVPPPGAIQPTAENPEVEPVQIRLPDGSYMLDMKGSNVEYMVIKRDADGKPVVECTKDPKAATAAPAVPKREEK